MIINPYIIFSPPLLLDTYPSAAAAYSVRKLRTAYTGNCLRIRRSSDNAETDIGFSGNNIDTAAITTFVGANNGFVTSWYDQSGNANNLVQTTAVNQMQIVSSGTILSLNGKPALRSQTVLKGMSSISNFNFTQCYIAIVFNRTGRINATDNLFIFDQSPFYQLYSNSTNWSMFTAGYVVNTTIPLSIAQKLFSFNYDGTLRYYYDNGVLNTTTNVGFPPFSLSNAKLQIMAYFGNNNGTQGDVQEFIFYTTNKTTDRAAIELEIKTFYGI